MPLVEALLGVQLDMPLLGKLALSVAGVLLVSWAYRFYSSRSRGDRGTGPGSGRPNGTAPWTGALAAEENASSWEAESRPQDKPSPGETPVRRRKQPPKSPETDSVDPATPDAGVAGAGMSLEPNPDLPAEGSVELTGSVEQHSPPETTQTPTAYGHSSQRPLHRDCEGVEGKVGEDLILGSSLSPPPMEDRGGTSLSGRRSPCMLRRLEPSGGVGRELRQDAGHPGAISCFLSQAEVRVEGGDFLLEREEGGPVTVRGRIYDYRVESSSQSFSEESALAGPSSPRPGSELWEGEMSPDPQGVTSPELGGSSAEPVHMLSPLPASALILQDLLLPPTPPQPPPAPVSANLPAARRHGLNRQDSYQQIVENSDLQIPLLHPRASTPVGTLSSEAPSLESLRSGPPSPLKDPSGHSGDASEDQRPDDAARLGVSQADSGSVSELERLQGSLDLGNCLRALSLARKHGHTGLQRAALRVMSDNYLQVLKDPGLYGGLRGGDRDQIQKLRTRGRRFLVVADLDPQDWAGPESARPEPGGSGTTSRLFYYDDYKDSWHPLCPLPREVVSRGCAMCTMDNYLFVAVGCEGAGRDVRPSRRVFCYNPATSIWREICPMREARPQCKLVALQGYVYAVGGECLSSVERYDPRADRWAFVAPMPGDTFAVAHRATACNGELFVSGGTLRYTLLRYNPATDAWRRSLIVGSRERTADMVAARSFLYRFDVGPALSPAPGVSVYRYHVAARLWYQCGSRSLPHCPAFQCAVIDDVIYCVSRQFTLRFLADDVSPAFATEDLSVLSEAKGILLPFVLVLPETDTLQTRV
ncbi:kelch domain-containing protein 7A [Megalops cyprinoides]|uniref:kelch domain-containing protein 7A n=1 Tax=Megalops cyprinoides TaxID=118141 RepID=UPI001864ABDF|nr:kelch domain-containing protein 7A [Megalops cyprinoides]